MGTTPSYFSIGKLVKILEADFPDISVSKVRFLESKGLINPERSTSGYRRYGEKDINQLRWVLSLQRDHFLPLKVIKERLVGDGNSERSETFQLPQLDPSSPPDESLEFTKSELLKRTGLSEEKFKEFRLPLFFLFEDVIDTLHQLLLRLFLLFFLKFQRFLLLFLPLIYLHL